VKTGWWTLTYIKWYLQDLVFFVSSKVRWNQTEAIAVTLIEERDAQHSDIDCRQLLKIWKLIWKSRFEPNRRGVNLILLIANISKVLFFWVNCLRHLLLSAWGSVLSMFLAFPVSGMKKCLLDMCWWRNKQETVRVFAAAILRDYIGRQSRPGRSGREKQ
jgi:hypothetical protein